MHVINRNIARHKVGVYPSQTGGLLVIKSERLFWPYFAGFKASIGRIISLCKNFGHPCLWMPKMLIDQADL